MLHGLEAAGARLRGAGGVRGVGEEEAFLIQSATGFMEVREDAAYVGIGGGAEAAEDGFRGAEEVGAAEPGQEGAQV